MIDQEPAKTIISFLVTDYRLFEVFWNQTNREDREDMIQRIAEIIDEHIEFNYR